MKDPNQIYSNTLLLAAKGRTVMELLRVNEKEQIISNLQVVNGFNSVQKLSQKQTDSESYCLIIDLQAQENTWEKELEKISSTLKIKSVYLISGHLCDDQLYRAVNHPLVSGYIEKSDPEDTLKKLAALIY